jgi:hypothetical protein
MVGSKKNLTLAGDRKIGVVDKWVDICIRQLKTELMISQVFGLD